jgi:serine protease Do
MTHLVDLLPSRRPGVVLAGIMVLCLAGPVQAQEVSGKSSPAMIAAFKNVVANPSQSTVRVHCNDKEAALGTVLSADGWIITKASELKGKIRCTLKDGRSFPAKVVGVEDRHDLAMLKIEAKDLRPIEWRESKSAEVGNWLASPGIQGEPVCIGVVSVATRRPGPGQLPMSAKAEKAGFLGVILTDAEGAAKVVDIGKDTPASKAGLQVGDLLLKVGGHKVTSRGSIAETLQRFSPGKTVVLEIRRGDEVRELKATLGKRKLDRADLQNRMGSPLSDRRDGFPTILQNDQVIKPSDCGGPLVDLDGKAVGINIARAGRVESYAIPTEAVLALVDDLKSGKLAPPPGLAGPIVAEMEKSLEKIRADVTRIQNELKAAEDARRSAEKKKKELEEQLGAMRKKIAAAEEALKKAKSDATKK